MSCKKCHEKECCCRRGPRGHEGPPGKAATIAAYYAAVEDDVTIDSDNYITITSIELQTDFPTSKLLITATFSASTLVPGATGFFRLKVNGIAQPESAGVSLYGGNVFDGGSLQALVLAPEGVAYKIELQAKRTAGAVVIRPKTHEGEHADLLVQELQR